MRYVALILLGTVACRTQIGGTIGTGGSAAGSSGSGGASGSAGLSGAAGTTGTGGATGTAGLTGSAGATGAAGITGAAGRGGSGTAGSTAGAGGEAASSGRGGATGAAGRGGTTGTAGAAAGQGGVAGAGTQPYKGLASYNGCTDLGVLDTSWYYTWSTSTSCTSNAQFVPQMWGHPGENYANEVRVAASDGHPYILGFNEPDNSGQSNMSVATAIGLWPQLTTDKALLVGSPATSANSAGQTWFSSFMSMVNNDTTGTLRVDFITMHWYGWNAGSCEPSAATLESYLEWVEAIPGNRPIWITEWGCLNVSDPTAAGVQSFLSGALAMLAKHPRVVRYAWFESRTGDPNTTLVNSDATLTPLGSIYAKAPPTK